MKGRCTECGRIKNNYTTIKCSVCFKFTCKNHLGKTEQLCKACCSEQEKSDED